MSRSRKHAKGPGHEYWGRRSVAAGSRKPGPLTKRWTHRAERRQAKTAAKADE